MKLKVNCSIGLIGQQYDEIEIDDAELNDLDEDERKAYLHKAWFEWAVELLDGGYEEIE